jgi:hypothetical protein
VHRHSGPVDRLQHASPRTASLMAFAIAWLHIASSY